MQKALDAAIAAEAEVAKLTAESAWWATMVTKYTPWEGKHVAGDTCSAFDVVANIGGVSSRAPPLCPLPPLPCLPGQPTSRVL